ncbi:MAG: aminotransferase class IV, partial [Parachlamydiales bacterium]|nr:aminotransferase class IV [Parachlamydiales bacterium]
MTYVFYDGQFLPADQPCLTLNHRGFLFGDGVFTTMAVQNGLLEGYHCHIQRLIKQCDKLNIKMPELSMSWISQLIELNQASGGRWRLKMIVTVENACNLALPDREGKWALLLEPVALTNKPLKVITYHKPINHALSCFKTLSYLERLYLKQYAIDLNVDDVLVTHNGHIVEGAFSSLFWVMDETIFAPHNHFALPSTTLNHIVNAAN